MNGDVYHTWGRFGTNHDRKGRVLTGRTPVTGIELKAEELAVYEMLCAPSFTGYRRLEQERIPLPVAREGLESLIASG